MKNDGRVVRGLINIHGTVLMYSQHLCMFFAKRNSWPTESNVLLKSRSMFFSLMSSVTVSRTVLAFIPVRKPGSF